MKHRQRADKQDDVYQECEIRDEAGNFVIDRHADERDHEANQAGENACANRIHPEGGRDAALLLDAHRCLQGVLEHASQTARFLFREFSGDDSVAAIDRIANDRRRLNEAIENNCEAVAFVLLGDLTELLGAFAVELQLHGPALVAVVSVRS